MMLQPKNIGFTILLLCLLSAGCKSKKLMVNDAGFIDMSQFDLSSNGQKDMTADIQKIFDANAKQGKFFFPKGTYMIDNVDIYAGIHILGEEGTIFLKKPRSAKFSRMFNTANRRYLSSRDSKLINIEGITMDGNMENQGSYRKYELEHQAMMFFMADNSQKGRLKVNIANCDFQNGVGDAISIYTNVEADIQDCNAIDVFRGVVTVTGGHTKVNVSKVTAYGDIHNTGIDVEVDGVGFGKSKTVELDYRDVTVKGDMDIKVSHGSSFYGENLKCLSPPYNLYASDSKVHLKNCEIHTSGIDKCKVYFPYNVLIEDTDFYISDSEDSELYGAMLVYWNTSYAKKEDSKLTLKNCNFISEIKGRSKKVTAIKMFADDYTQNNLLELEDVEFKGDFEHNIYMKQGGNLKLKNVSLSGDDALYLGSSVGKSKYRYKADFQDVISSSKSIIKYTENSENQISIDDKSAKLIQPVKARKSRTKILKKN